MSKHKLEHCLCPSPLYLASRYTPAAKCETTLQGNVVVNLNMPVGFISENMLYLIRDWFVKAIEWAEEQKEKK